MQNDANLKNAEVNLNAKDFDLSGEDIALNNELVSDIGDTNLNKTGMVQSSDTDSTNTQDTLFPSPSNDKTTQLDNVSLGSISSEASQFQKASQLAESLMKSVSQAVIGQEEVIKQLCVCLIAGGHALVEGLPGLGKTLMVKAFAQAIGGSYHRVQFTPDLMPADITGHTLYDMQTGKWKVRRGPVFCNILLADEINRASAKTQAALLEVMQEQQVTIEGTTYPVADPFVTIATQNPLEHEGTYPLPEAQLDRFLFNIMIDFPSEDNEATMLKSVLNGKIGATLNLSDVPQVISPDTLVKLQKLSAQVNLDDRVIKYAAQLVRMTRQAQGIAAGSGPRGGIALLRAARANALIEGRQYVIPDDVVSMAVPVLRHRISLSADYQIEGIRTDQVIEQVVSSIAAPRQ